MPEYLTTYLHYLGYAVLVAALVLELFLLRPQLDAATARRLALADLAYGLAAVLMLVTGLLRVVAGSKPAAYYAHNWLFHLKVTLFLVIVGLSVYPTLRFVKQRRLPPGAGAVYPAAVRRLVTAELILALLLPLLAVLMARGYGYTG